MSGTTVIVLGLFTKEDPPPLQIKLGGVSLDLLFASLPLPKLPTNPIDLASPAL